MRYFRPIGNNGSKRDGRFKRDRRHDLDYATGEIALTDSGGAVLRAMLGEM
jgi:hypothetical protein